MYFLGEGVEKSAQESYYWLTVARAQLTDDSKQERETVGYFSKKVKRGLSDEEIDQIELRASEFLPE